MNNREKIISAIEKAKKQSEESAQDIIIVPFKETDMILALLKEQKAKTGHWIEKEDYNHNHGELVRCNDCKWYDEHISMCDNCGLPREQTFFCADGERRDDDG